MSIRFRYKTLLQGIYPMHILSHRFAYVLRKLCAANAPKGNAPCEDLLPSGPHQ